MVDGLALTLRTLLFGPLRHLPTPLWPWLLLTGLWPLVGLVALRRQWSGLGLALWLLLPIGLMAAVGLFTAAFLKFLLVTSPAWCLLLAAAPLLPGAERPTRTRLTGVSLLALLVAGFGLAAAWAVLPTYYADPMARDNYKGVAAYLAAAGDPARDLVILDAPGQQEVWHYYDPGLPVLALPQQRPPDVAQTEAAMSDALTGKRRAYVLFWAMDEADPNGVVATWLARNLFKSLESWQGNLRLAVYDALPPALNCDRRPIGFGTTIVLAAVCRPPSSDQTAPGEPVLVQLEWRATAPVDLRYKTTLQLLDSRNQVIAQQDAEPLGGARPTDSWTPGETTTDKLGLPVPYGTPPGRYRLILALYDPVTGQRLSVDSQTAPDTVELGEVIVPRPASPLPAELLPITQRQERSLGPVKLLGYDQAKRGFAHAPETPLARGDQVHFTLYWQAPELLSATWPADLTFTLTLGDQTLSAPLAGGAYPTGAWQAGEIVRGEFDVIYDGSSKQATLTVGGEELEMALLPVAPYITNPIAW